MQTRWFALYSVMGVAFLNRCYATDATIRQNTALSRFIPACFAFQRPLALAGFVCVLHQGEHDARVFYSRKFF
jgi:hypothetical protein